MLRILALALVALGIAAGVMGQQVYEPGNGVTLPRVIKEVRPQYTPQAKVWAGRRGEQGVRTMAV